MTRYERIFAQSIQFKTESGATKDRKINNIKIVR